MDTMASAKLLLVEDEARTARTLAKMLREDGFEVEVALDGAEAIGKLTRDALPDALVTDLRMPVVDGVAVARYARSRAPSMPVVFVTGYPQLVANARMDPAPAVHTKPVDYRELRRHLREVLATRLARTVPAI
jgi:CheY-like chemotaxis protein